MKYILYLFFLFFVLPFYAQLKKADTYFSNFEYSKALKIYEKEITKIDVKDTAHMMKMGISYLKTFNYDKAEITFEKLAKIDAVQPVVYLYYAEILQSNSKIAKAKEYYKKYCELVPNDARAKHLLASARELDKNDSLNWVKVKNVNEINTVYSEFSPALFKDNLYFTSNRKNGSNDNENCGWTNQPYYTIYKSAITNLNDSITSYKQPKTISIKNKYTGHSGITTFDTTNKIIYFNHSDNHPSKDTNSVNHVQLYSSKLIDKGKWAEPISFQFNSPKYSIEHPSVSADGSLLFFSSDMPGGFGGKDIYCSKKIDNVWTNPINLGEEINTEGDEVFPFLKSNNQLYFSSNGHEGYGGLDIYLAYYNGKKWTDVINMKIPLNSTHDDFGITYLSKENGFFSSNRNGGVGEDDIYYFKFNREKLVITLIDKKENTPVINFSAIIAEQDRILYAGKSNSNGEITVNTSTTPYKSIYLEVPDPTIDLKIDPKKLGQHLKVYLTKDRKITDTLEVDKFGNFTKKQKAVDNNGYDFIGKIEGGDNKQKTTLQLISKEGIILAEVIADDNGNFSFKGISKDKQYGINVKQNNRISEELKSVIKGKILNAKTLTPEKGILLDLYVNDVDINIKTTTDEKGEFVFEFRYLKKDRPDLKNIFEKDPRLQAIDFSKPADENGYNFIGKIEGGNNTEKSTIQLISKEGEIIAQVTTDDNGNFSFNGISKDKQYGINVKQNNRISDELKSVIKGKILNAKTLTPEKGILIDLYVNDVDINIKTTTDEKGEFVFEFRYLKKDRPDLKNIFEKDPRLQSIDFSKPADENGYNIIGKIEGGNNTEKSTIQLISKEGEIIAQVTTDDNGNFSFNGISKDKQYGINVKQNNRISDELKSVIKGKILNAKTLTPEKGILLDLYVNDVDINIKTTTDEKGDFVFEFRYLKKDKPDLKNIFEKDPRLQSIDFSKPADENGYNFIGKIEGGNNTEKSTIQLISKEGEIIAQVTTDDNGNFSFKGISKDKQYGINVKQNNRISDELKSVIKGKILNAKTLTPEKGILLDLYVNDVDINIKTTTDEKGEFVFEFRYLKKDRPDLKNIFEKDTRLPEFNINGNVDIKGKDIDYSKIQVVLIDDKGVIISKKGLNGDGYFFFKNLPIDKKMMMKLFVPDGYLNYKAEITGFVSSKNNSKLDKVELLSNDNILMNEAEIDDKGMFKLMSRPIDKNGFDFIGKIEGGDNKQKTTVQLIGKEGIILAEVIADDNGNFTFKGIAKDQQYGINVKQNNSISEELKRVIKGKILNAKTLSPEKGILIELYVNDTDLNIKTTTDELGGYSLIQTTTKLKTEIKLLDSLRINFDYNSLTVNKNDIDNIRNSFEKFPELKTKNYEIVINTDSRGSTEYNDMISIKRGNSVKNQLILLGVPLNKIKVIANGERKIKNGCVDGVECSEEQHKENRNCSILIKD